MLEVERIGRMVLFRFPDRVTGQDIPPFVADIRAGIGLVVKGGQRVVSIGDLSQTAAMPPDVTEGLVNLMKGDNPAIERTGVVVSNATVGLQVERMFREANSPVRKAFRTLDDVLRWAGEVLTKEEVAQARAWLAK